MPLTTIPILRVARPSDDLDALLRFYRDGLGFIVLDRFADHDGFDGVMLGHPRASYHLEFTMKRGHRAGRAASQDNLLVFYLPDAAEWRAAVERMRRRVLRRCRRSIRIGIATASPSRIPMAIASCCKTRLGKPNAACSSIAPDVKAPCHARCRAHAVIIATIVIATIVGA